jgi:hypothetical protein
VRLRCLKGLHVRRGERGEEKKKRKKGKGRRKQAQGDKDEEGDKTNPLSFHFVSVSDDTRVKES